MTIYVHVSNNTEPTADVVSSSHPGKKIKGRGKTTWFSVQKKQKDIDNEKLKVIIPPDRTVAVGPGAKDFVTELSVKVLLHARHDVKKWKDVPNLAKDRIVAHMLCMTPFNFQTHNTIEILSLKQLIIYIDIVVVGSTIISINLLRRRKACITCQQRLMKLNGIS
ncbi:uncharacterized protein LOC107786477 isoform X2 [Nicotiana tabacum]|uniref:Uncharacterized protein LOC107786477 isoform X2 n=6 Tax=Nicotiana tabacum TaxID=4097 RepID=A0AC58S069_TOBAC